MNVGSGKGNTKNDARKNACRNSIEGFLSIPEIENYFSSGNTSKTKLVSSFKQLNKAKDQDLQLTTNSSKCTYLH